MLSEFAEDENSEMLLISVVVFHCETACELRNLRPVDGSTDDALVLSLDRDVPVLLFAQAFDMSVPTRALSGPNSKAEKNHQVLFGFLCFRLSRNRSVPKILGDRTKRNSATL